MTLLDETAATAAPSLTDREIVGAYRRWGYLKADLDWLGRLPPAEQPELPTEGEVSRRAREVYCGTVGVEFMHIADPARRRWIQERMEAPAPDYDRERTLDLLMRATTGEEVLQSRYIGNKRFSIEGIESLIPLLGHILAVSSEYPVQQAVLAMSHRGRLNVMGQIVGVDPVQLLAGFEDVDPRSILGAGDVKYHMGATGVFDAGKGRKISIHLVSNPSHLEAVNPVAMGRVRAKQTRLDAGTETVLPVIMHGDAAFAGQGITAETLNLADVPGFGVGGSVHIVVNNLIGFTAEPPALHSGRFASDVARRLPVPIFHVNGEDLDAVARVGRIATDFRFQFHTDVVIDLIGHRKHGHSEVDDPTITQPLLYQRIRSRPPLWKSFAERIGAPAEETEERLRLIRGAMDKAKARAEELTTLPVMRQFPGYWSPYVGGPYKPEHEVPTGLSRDALERLARRLVATPEDFHVHPKVEKLLEQRAEMGRGARPVDYGMAEALAFASLVEAGHPVRMSGQDSRRGTFNQRHAVLIDHQTRAEHCPLAHVSEDQARFEIYDSVLSEAGVLGYEYGFSRDYPEALALWEAQFGDFANGAQAIFDQFVTAGEDKWGLLSGLVVLLPHGFEGQGPEHSSARIERFLQLAAEDAIQVAQPSSAAQYFHLLRRQTLRKWRKPLIVFTPKSMLRHQSATSPLESFERESFQQVHPDGQVEDARRVLLCSGKIRHELQEERTKRQADDVAVVSLEQLYPFPEEALKAELDRHPRARSILWVQEEPANMGPLFFVRSRIEHVARRQIHTVKRSASASPATGSFKAHRMEQQTLLNLAFR